MPWGEKEACIGENEDGAMEIERERGNRGEIPENEKMKKKERGGEEGGRERLVERKNKYGLGIGEAVLNGKPLCPSSALSQVSNLQVHQQLWLAN